MFKYIVYGFAIFGFIIFLLLCLLTVSILSDHAEEPDKEEIKEIGEQ